MIFDRLLPEPEPPKDPDEIVDEEFEYVLKQMRRDAQRGPVEWRPFFGELEPLLFDPDCSITKLRKKTDVHRPKDTAEFERYFLCQPREYLSRTRAEAGVRLVSKTDLKIFKIARLVGFRSRSSFDKACHKVYQRTPSEFRTEFEFMSGDFDPVRDMDRYRELFGMRYTPEEAEEELDNLFKTIEAIENRPSSTYNELESLLADDWWNLTKELPFAERARELDKGLFKTTEAFGVFCKQSREEGRLDPERAVELAELAIETLRKVSPDLGEDERDRMAVRGWACAANARRLIGDYEGAEHAFSNARLRLSAYPQPTENVAAVVIFYEALLRLAQKRLRETVELCDWGLSVCPFEDQQLRAELYLVRGMARRQLGEWADAVHDFTSARVRIDPIKEPYVSWLAIYCLAEMHFYRGDHDRAWRCLERAEPQSHTLSEQEPRFRSKWLEGMLSVAEDKLPRAARSFRAAQAGFLRFGPPALAALATLDLAKVALLRGLGKEALEVVGSRFAEIEALGLSGAAGAAVESLGKALEAGELSPEDLAAVRPHVLRLEVYPQL